VALPTLFTATAPIDPNGIDKRKAGKFDSVDFIISVLNAGRVGKTRK
jgi:hypothetical protein